MICEHCNDSVEHIGISHSSVAVLQKVTPDGYQFYQCEDGQEHEYVTYQHYGCSKEHMLHLFEMCIKEHYREEFLHGIPPGGGTTRMHRVVLGHGIPCKVCQSGLDAQAYRFCLTVCTPVNIVPDGSQDHLQEWCCSLDHARQSALATLESIDY